MCSRGRSSRSSPPLSPRAPSPTRTNIASTRACLGLRAQDGLPRPRRVCPRRGRGRVLRGPCQHDRGFLVAAAFLVATAPGHLAGQAAALPRLLPVRAQRTPTRQNAAQSARRRLGCMTNSSPPWSPIRAAAFCPGLLPASQFDRTAMGPDAPAHQPQQVLRHLQGVQHGDAGFPARGSAQEMG